MKSGVGNAEITTFPPEVSISTDQLIGPNAIAPVALIIFLLIIS